LLDSGNTCPITGRDPKARTNIIFKAMETMGYAAMNAGLNEVCCPQSIVNRELPAFPVISSNLIRKDTGEPAAAPFVIKSVESLRVGILGILPPEILSGRPDSAYIDQYDIISPELAINQYLPGLKQKTDLIVLLSQCSQKITRHLVHNTDGIDVAIVSGRGNASARQAGDCKKDPSGTRIIRDEPAILYSGRNGTSVGYLKINFSESNDIVSYQNDTIQLDESFQETPAIKAMIDSFLHDPIRKKKRKTLQNADRREEIEALQQLSPEEYIKTLQK